MSDLAEKTCGPCNNLTPRLSREQIAVLAAQTLRWDVVGRKICRRWDFKDFSEALAFVNKVAVIAEAENHHPDFHFGWGFVILTIWTHAINGLSENDFILAAKIDAIS
jgi:4a-hydroxytetrahydrobiopterin dehydratase